jgi:hypothetical protein
MRTQSSFELFTFSSFGLRCQRVESAGIPVDAGYEYAEGLQYKLTIGEKTTRKRIGKRDQFASEPSCTLSRPWHCGVWRREALREVPPITGGGNP